MLAGKGEANPRRSLAPSRAACGSTCRLLARPAGQLLLLLRLAQAQALSLKGHTSTSMALLELSLLPLTWRPGTLRAWWTGCGRSMQAQVQVQGHPLRLGLPLRWLTATAACLRRMRWEGVSCWT